MRKHTGLFWFSILGVLALSLACNILPPTPAPRPPAEWDSSPSALIVEALLNKGFPGGGFSPEAGYSLNYIPHARIYGDGRIIWVHEREGPRTVWHGQLNQVQMTNLLQGIIDMGFFGWKGSSGLPLDNPPFDELNITLNSASHLVHVAAKRPEGFSTLFTQLLDGAGAEGKSEFVPEKGFLTARPVDDTFSDPLPIWQPDELGFSLAEVGDGKYISGAALEYVWTQVNRYPYWAAYLQTDSQAYEVYLQIPGISWIEPPTETPDLWITPQAAPSVTDTPESATTVVTGEVLVEDGRGAMGGIPGNTIDAEVTFTANSTAAPVTEMRVKIGCYEEALDDAAWEPFVSQKSYPVYVILNWTGWGISVQYRDANGNVSPTYCDDINVEGMEVPPTP